MNAIPLGDLLRYQANRKQPDAVALVYPNAPGITWLELDARAERRARLYRALGVRKDDLVAIALANGPAFHETVFAVWKLGATPAVLSPRLPDSEFSAIVDLVKPRLVIGGPLAGRSQAITSLPSDHEVAGLEEPLVRLRSDVATYWKAMCSGGSTGRAKIIIDHMRSEYDPAAKGLHSVAGLPADGVILNPGPLHHNGPFLFTSLALFVGSKVVSMERFDAEETLRLIEAHRVNWVCFVPTMMHRIWSLPRAVRERYDLSSLQSIWHMAAPCPAWLKQAWIEWLGGERIWEAYSGTEGFGITLIRGDEWLRRRGSVGRIIGGGKVKAVKQDGNDCSPGEVGELFFLPAGAARPSHYLGAEVRASAEGWVSIGDLGSVDADGYVFLADRRTDLILRGGVNIYPAEVEAALDEHPAVASSVVIGLPCEEMGARVHAIIEPRGESAADVRAIHAFLATRLAKYKLPESFEFVRQPLRDEAGKVRRMALRDERINWLDQGREFRTQIPRQYDLAGG